MGKIQRIYRDEVCQGGKEGLAHLSSIDRENFPIVRKLVENGAVFEATEDSLLVAESKSWLEMIEQDPLDTMPLELYQETVRERDGYVTRRIDETLLDEETGVLFLKPGREINLNERVKIIKVCRFDPADYLRSWQVQLNSPDFHTEPAYKPQTTQDLVNFAIDMQAKRQSRSNNNLTNKISEDNSQKWQTSKTPNK